MGGREVCLRVMAFPFKGKEAGLKLDVRWRGNSDGGTIEQRFNH